jgi:hypothetical protein
VLIRHNDQQVPSFHPIPRNRFMASPEPFRPNLVCDYSTATQAAARQAEPPP